MMSSEDSSDSDSDELPLARLLSAEKKKRKYSSTKNSEQRSSRVKKLVLTKKRKALLTELEKEDLKSFEKKMDRLQSTTNKRRKTENLLEENKSKVQVIKKKGISKSDDNDDVKEKEKGEITLSSSSDSDGFSDDDDIAISVLSKKKMVKIKNLEKDSLPMTSINETEAKSKSKPSKVEVEKQAISNDFEKKKKSVDFKTYCEEKIRIQNNNDFEKKKKSVDFKTYCEEKIRIQNNNDFEKKKKSVDFKTYCEEKIRIQNNNDFEKKKKSVDFKTYCEEKIRIQNNNDFEKKKKSVDFKTALDRLQNSKNSRVSCKEKKPVQFNGQENILLNKGDEKSTETKKDEKGISLQREPRAENSNVLEKQSKIPTTDKILSPTNTIKSILKETKSQIQKEDLLSLTTLSSTCSEKEIESKSIPKKKTLKWSASVSSSINSSTQENCSSSIQNISKNRLRKKKSNKSDATIANASFNNMRKGTSFKETNAAAVHLFQTTVKSDSPEIKKAQCIIEALQHHASKFLKEISHLKSHVRAVRSRNELLESRLRIHDSLGERTSSSSLLDSPQLRGRYTSIQQALAGRRRRFANR
eukprot:g5925.t1